MTAVPALAVEDLSVEFRTRSGTVKVLGMVKSMGGQFKRIFLVGCEPAPLPSEDGHMGLSEPVERAVDEAVKVVESLARKILEEERRRATPV